METLEQVGFVDLTEVGKRLSAVGRTNKHITRNIRKAGFTLHLIHRQRGRSGFAMTKEDAEKYLSTFENQVIRSEKKVTIGETQRRSEEQIRQQREDAGWISFRLSSPGMPDLINLKPRGDGLFEILFEEVKGQGDGLRKEQHSVLEGMKQKGILTTVTWL